MITEYRKRVAYTPIEELLQQLIADTAYDAFVGSMPGGDQRMANIELLLEKARDLPKYKFLWTVSFYSLSGNHARTRCGFW